jgi:hypothetical protein
MPGSDALAEEYREVEIEVVTCDGCGLSPVTGRRYMCNECAEFDLCGACHEKGVSPTLHDPAHSFRLVAIPAAAPAASADRMAAQLVPPPPPPPRTKWTRRVPHPVLIGHAAPPASPRSTRASHSPRAALPSGGRERGARGSGGAAR